MIECNYSAYRVITRLQWCIWESYALSCVYGYALWDTQHTHTIADKLCGSCICIKSCIYSTITTWIFLYCYHDREFYIDISIYCAHHYLGGCCITENDCYIRINHYDFFIDCSVRVVSHSQTLSPHGAYWLELTYLLQKVWWLYNRKSCSRFTSGMVGIDWLWA